VPPPAAGAKVAGWPPGRAPVWAPWMLSPCGGGNRGGNDAELAVQGLVVSGGEVMSGTGAVRAGIVRVRGDYLLAVCLDEAFDKRIDIARLG
jgi:hypothetical protein